MTVSTPRERTPVRTAEDHQRDTDRLWLDAQTRRRRIELREACDTITPPPAGEAA